jgi:hypothetical protein
MGYTVRLYLKTNAISIREAIRQHRTSTPKQEPWKKASTFFQRVLLEKSERTRCSLSFSELDIHNKNNLRGLTKRKISQGNV